jgi:hypothetical protein
MFLRILVVLDDAKIRFDMQAANRAPLVASGHGWTAFHHQDVALRR